MEIKLFGKTICSMAGWVGGWMCAGIFTLEIVELCPEYAAFQPHSFS